MLNVEICLYKCECILANATRSAARFDDYRVEYTYIYKKKGDCAYLTSKRISKSAYCQSIDKDYLFECVL